MAHSSFAPLRFDASWTNTSRLTPNTAICESLPQSELANVTRLANAPEGTVEFASPEFPADFTGLSAFRVSFRARCAATPRSPLGVLLGFAPVDVPPGADYFTSGFCCEATPEWRDFSVDLANHFTGPARFLVNYRAPGVLELSDLQVAPIPLAEHRPLSIRPIPREEAARARFHQAVEQAVADRVKVVFLGDSITDNWDNPAIGLPHWEQHFVPLGVTNWAIGGDRVEHTLWKIDHAPLGTTINPQLFVVLAGINNIFQVHGPDDIEAGVRQLLATLRSRCPAARILLQGVYPIRHDAANPMRTRVRELNRRYAALADNRHISYRDLGPVLLEPDGTLSPSVVPDNTHPNAAGYARLAPPLLAAIREVLSAP